MVKKVKQQKNLKDYTLPYRFYNQGTEKVSRNLLGKLLVHKTTEGITAGIITETEAYLGKDDPASHAARKKTPRNSIMFDKSGKSYVYFIYGNHYCFNVVAHIKGIAGAVLIRSLEPYQGIKLMQKRRKKNKLKDLTTGPGKLTQALKITRSCNNLDLKKSSLYIANIGFGIKSFKIIRTSRIGIKNGKDKLLRFYIKDNQYVSRK